MEDKDQGNKFDDDKLRYDLVPAAAMEQFVKVLTYGASKYDDRNWEKGIVFGRIAAALERHLAAWKQHENVDSESGLPHLAHVVCNAMFLLHFMEHYEKYRQYDDRPDYRSMEQGSRGKKKQATA